MFSTGSCLNCLNCVFLNESSSSIEKCSLFDGVTFLKCGFCAFLLILRLKRKLLPINIACANSVSDLMFLCCFSPEI